MKLELNGRFDFNAKKCFDTIDKSYPYNTLDRNEIRDFVAEYYTILSEDDLDAIIRRCDTDEDEQISYNEFVDVVTKTSISPVIKKFTGSFKGAKHEENLSKKLSWRNLNSRYYDRTYNRDFYGSRLSNRTLYSKYHSPHKLSWKNLSRAYDPYWKNEKYSSAYRHHPSTLYRDYRYSFLEPITRKRGASATKKSVSTKKMLLNNDLRNTFGRETFSSLMKKSSPTVNRVSQSSYNYRRSNSPVAKNRNTWKNSLYDGMRARLSGSTKRRPTTNTKYSPARRTLKTRFDVADELVEEVVTPVKEEKFSSSKKSQNTAHTLRSSEEDLFVDSLRELISLDKDLERAKQSLALKSDFTLQDAFNVFDFRDTGIVNLDDIIEAFELFHVFPTREEARLFLSRYDINKNNNLNFEEFCEAFLPLHKGTADILQNRSDNYPNGYYNRRDEFSSATIDAFSRVLNIHLEVEITAEGLRQRHEESPHFRYDSAFSTLNKWGEDYLTARDFKEIFKKYGFHATEEELDILVDRFDKDKNGKISYDEFFDEFSPHSPVKV